MVPANERMDLRVSSAFKALVASSAEAASQSLADWLTVQICEGRGLRSQEYLLKKKKTGRKPQYQETSRKGV